MKPQFLIIVAMFVLTQINACAKYEPTGKGKSKNSDKVQDQGKNFGDPGGRERHEGDVGIWETNDGTFTIHATPHTTAPGGLVVFKATCFDNKNVDVKWDFADGTSGQGLDQSHTFANLGQYIVKAVCTASTGETRAGQVTIDIVNPSTGSNGGTSCGCCCCCRSRCGC